MNVQIQSVRFNADSKLEAFVKEKVSKLARFADDIVASEVTLRLDKDNEHGNKVAVIKVEVRGNDLIAERQCETFEEAVDLSVEALKKQLEKHKNRK